MYRWMGQRLSTDGKNFWKVFLVLFVIYVSFALCHHVSTQFQDTNIDFRQWTGYLTGDEPSYLIYTRSIVKHGTINVSQTYLELNWPPAYWHGITVRTGVFPFHGIGLPLLLIVPYLVAGVFGCMLFMCGMTSLVGAYIFRVCNLVTRRPRYALATALVFGVTVLLPFSSQIYPDMIASLVTLFVLADVFFEYPQKHLALAGILIGFSTFLNVKFLVLFAAPILYILYISILHRKLRELATFSFPILLFLSLYCYYTWYYFGTVFFTNYTATYKPSLDFTSNGILGLLIDRQHGVLPYFPALYLVFFGVTNSARIIGRNSLNMALMSLSYYTMTGFFSFWKGGVTTAGREILPILLVCSIPFCTTLIQFGHRMWFKFLSSILLLVNVILSIIITWWKSLGMRGGLYAILSSRLGIDVGLFWPNFVDALNPNDYSAFRPYDYLFIWSFIACTALITLLSHRRSLATLRH